MLYSEEPVYSYPLFSAPYTVVIVCLVHYVIGVLTSDALTGHCHFLTESATGPQSEGA